MRFSPAVRVQAKFSALFLFLSMMQPNLAAQGSPMVLTGSLNPRARRLADQGPVESEMRLTHITLTLRRTPEQRAALDRLLAEQQDPASPNFQRWLTPEEFGARFGASEETVKRIADWLRSEGFTVEPVARGRGWIIFSGTAAQVQKTFHSEIRRYQAGARLHFAPSAAPAIPREFALFVNGIRGLDDFYPEPRQRLSPMNTTSNGTHALAPGDIARIYDTNPSLSGPASIAVAGQSQVDLKDIRQFQSTFLLPANDPQTMLGGDDPGVDPDALKEADADLEWAGGVAPNATLIYVYAKNIFDAAQQAIDQNLAPILSFSYGACEQSVSSDDAAALRALAQQANAQGITWIASSGDAGAASCDQGSYPAAQGLSVSLPASLPEVTGIGGTEFNETVLGWLGQNLPDLSSVVGYLPEVAWNDTSAALGLRASGGGASVLYKKPDWQSGTGVPDDGARDVPDLSFSASPTHDPYIVFSGGKTYGAGGTSLSAPVFAGMLALAEANQPANGTAPAAGFGNINPSLYDLAGNGFPAIFHDIVTGNNVVPCTTGKPDCPNGQLGYSAGPGYDLVTGWGSVDFESLANALRIATTTTLSVSATQVPEGSSITLTAKVQSYNGAVPVGMMQFLSNGGSLTSAENLDASGMASATVTMPLRGTYSLTASYTATCCRFSNSKSAPTVVVVIPAPPPAPALVSPANGATGASLGVLLAWSQVAYATSYDVYFGTTPTPPFWGNVNRVIQQILPGSLAPNTKYYWSVAARNDVGATPSPVWSFTTTQGFYVITTIAGSSASGYTPDPVSASQSLLSGPSDVAIDPSGTLYIAETGGRIQRIDSIGVLWTVAGGGSGGDGGPATAAKLYPFGIAFDAQGNLYISERLTPDGISSIRRVSPTGVISTIAGGTTAGYSGDGGPAVNAKLWGPTALAVDTQGNLYIADTRNGCIREIVAGIISTFAGQCGQGGFTSGASVGDGGPAAGANLDMPSGVAVDAAGNVYIADSGNCRVRKVTNGIITTVVGLTDGLQGCNGPSAPPFRPVRVTLDLAGNLYFIDGNPDAYGNIVTGQIVIFENGQGTVIAGGGPSVPGDGGPATSAGLFGPSGLAVNSEGNIYLTENYYYANTTANPDYSQRVRFISHSVAYTPMVPGINFGGVENGASFATGPVAPGSIVSVFGVLSGGSPAQASGAPLPTELAGFSMQFQSLTGVEAPLFYTSRGQVNMQVPWELAGQTSVGFQPVLYGRVGLTETVQVRPFAPGIFVAGRTVGTILDSSYMLVEAINPVTAGSLIQIFCTGLGPVTNPPPSGSAASGTTLSMTTTKPTVTIGGVPANVVFSGLAPGAVGEYQVDAIVPAGITPGNAVALVLSIGGISANTVTIAVK